MAVKYHFLLCIPIRPFAVNHDIKVNLGVHYTLPVLENKYKL